MQASTEQTMETMTKVPTLKEKLCSVYEQNRSLISAGDLPFITELREKAFTHFKKLGFPHQGLEDGRGLRLIRCSHIILDYRLRPWPKRLMLKRSLNAKYPISKRFW